MHIPDGFGQCNWSFGGSGLPHGAQCTIGFEVVVPTDIDDIAAIFGAAWDEHMLPNQNDAVTLINTHIKLGPNDTGAFFDLSSSAAGGDGDAMVPPNVSYIFKKSTGLGGKHGHGRLYMPGVSESRVNDSGDIGSTWVTQLSNGAAALLDDIETAGLPARLLHAGASPVPTPITGMTAEARCATQRRRLRG